MVKVYQKYATLIQRYARGWSTRKRTTPMLRKARAQKADVASLLKGFKTRSNTLAAIFKVRFALNPIVPIAHNSPPHRQLQKKTPIGLLKDAKK